MISGSLLNNFSKSGLVIRIIHVSYYSGLQINTPLPLEILMQQNYGESHDLEFLLVQGDSHE